MMMMMMMNLTHGKPAQDKHQPYEPLDQEKDLDLA